MKDLSIYSLTHRVLMTNTWIVRLAFLFCVFCATRGFSQESPSVLYLTWLHDPSTTMTIQWHTEDKEPKTQVCYRELGKEEWVTHDGIHGKLSDSKYWVHTVELTDLKPDEEYEFFVADREGVNRFKTLPKELSRPLKFVVGGDAYYYFDRFCRMNAQIAAVDPDFIVIGGDIAYTNRSRNCFNNRTLEIRRWRTFLKQCKSQFVNSDGRLIPFFAVLGNHDIRRVSLNTKQDVLFYELFAMPEKYVPFRTVDCGDYLSLFLLDSGHNYHIGGAQTQWLAKKMEEREKVPYQFAAYHIGGYPSAYPYDGATPQEVRQYWSPLFEKNHINAAFEHHNHTYKRTFPIKEGKVDPEGVVYMGDGSWGVSPRKTKDLWYLKERRSDNVVCLVTLTKKFGTVEALNIDGKVVDMLSTFPIEPFTQ